MPTRYLTAQEAVKILGITRATLYAYTSRGQLRSEPVPGRTRESRYLREEVEALRERSEGRRDPSKAAARGLHWGSPVLESGITLISEGKVYYRGHDAAVLARDATFEQTAALLWEAPPNEAAKIFAQPSPLPARASTTLRAQAGDPLNAFQAALPLARDADSSAHDLRAAAVRQVGGRILRLLTSLVSGASLGRPAHLALQSAWAPKNHPAADAIRAALVLSADHELNVSAFVARCAASAGASPYDTVAAALATLRGYKHGGATERVAALFAETGSPGKARAVVAGRLRRGEGLPGIGHPLYPAGDPRAKLLLKWAEQAGNPAEKRLTAALRKAASDSLQEHPNLDFGLVALARAYELPENAPLVLFALGRTAGWIAHSMEQYAAGELIRPRARYTGPAPVSEALDAP